MLILKGEFQSTFEELRQEGFIRVKIDGEIYNLDEDEIIEFKAKHPDIYDKYLLGELK